MTKYKAAIQFGIKEVAPWGTDVIWIDSETVVGTIQEIFRANQELGFSAYMECQYYGPSVKHFANIAHIEYA